MLNHNICDKTQNPQVSSPTVSHVVIEHFLVLSFPTSNNQAEYEALLAGLRLAEDLGAREVQIYTDSQLVASQIGRASCRERV